MTTAAVDALAPYFFQVAYVVRDIAAAEEQFRQWLGVPSWFRMNDMEFGADCSFRGRPSDSAAHLSIGWLRDTQVELIEPLRGESLYQEFLDAKGPGLHHIAFDVPDFDATIATLSESGLDLLAKGRVGPGSRARCGRAFRGTRRRRGRRGSAGRAVARGRHP